MRVLETTSAVFKEVSNAFFPGLGALPETAVLLARRRLEEAERILRVRLMRGDISVLSDEAYAELVPVAYKFFEAAKAGEYIHNLKILAKIVADQIINSRPDAARFARHCRRLEALEVRELKMLIDIWRFATPRADDMAKPEEGRFIACASVLFRRMPDLFSSEVEVGASLGELAARGLIVPDGAARMGKSEEFYYPSPHIDVLVKAAEVEISSRDVADA
jgi:hypothetical protein